MYPVTTFGSKGQGPQQFKIIRDIAVTPTDTLIVTDMGQNTVREFDISGNFVRSIGSPGDGDGQFVRPRGVAVNGNGDIFITSKHKAQVFDNTGDFLFNFEQDNLNEPNGILLD